MELEKKTKEEIIKLKEDLEKMDLLNFLKYLKNEKILMRKILPKKYWKKKKKKKERNNIKKMIDELKEFDKEKKMDIEKENSKEEEKNDEESTIDGEINLINELKDISEKNNIKYDLVFQFVIKNLLIKKKEVFRKIL